MELIITAKRISLESDDLQAHMGVMVTWGAHTFGDTVYQNHIGQKA